jgi:hypothetical protein
MLQELAEEERASWEERAVYYASCVTNLAGEAFEALEEMKRSSKTAQSTIKSWTGIAFRRINGELEPSEMSSKMKRAARLWEDRVNQEFHRATRIVGRILQVHEGQPREASETAAGRGNHGNLDCPDEFLAGHEPTEDSDCRESMERYPTLRVAEILGTGRPEQSWDEAPESAEVRPAQSERSREIGDLRMPSLRNEGAPARLLARERRVIQPGGSGTPLEGNPGELLSSTFSGSSVQVDYWR